MALLETFVHDIQKNFDPEEIGIKVLSLNLHVDQPFLDLIIDLNDGEIRSESVTIDVIEYREVKLQNAVFSDIQLLQAHPLLWRYNDFHASLYFNGVAKDPYRLFWKLHRTHRGIYGALLSPETYWNTAFLDRDNFLPPFGFFACGPQKLMHVYARCFKEEGVSCSLTEAPQIKQDGFSRDDQC